MESKVSLQNSKIFCILQFYSALSNHDSLAETTREGERREDKSWQEKRKCYISTLCWARLSVAVERVSSLCLGLLNSNFIFVQNPFTYNAERVVGNGSFGVVFQATEVETSNKVAIKKVYQDKRYKNRELQIMKDLYHPNVIELKNAFYTQGDKVGLL